MGNRPLQNVRKRGPITNQAGGNYETSALVMIGKFFTNTGNILARLSFHKVLPVILYILIHC